MWTHFRAILSHHYADWRGRAHRAEFWRFTLACLLAYGAIYGMAFVLSMAAHRVTPVMNCVVALAGMALLPPFAALGARRLRDVGQGSWLVLTLIVPLAVNQLGWLLSQVPFQIPDVIYFYSTYGRDVSLFALMAAVALTSFWMQPDAAHAGSRTASVH